MAKRQTVIEINGRKYDADSGQQLSAGSVTHNARKGKMQVVDGFSAPLQARGKKPSAKAVHQKTTKKSRKSAKKRKCDILSKK